MMRFFVAALAVLGMGRKGFNREAVKKEREELNKLLKK
jgi:hypothetical protein